MLNKGLLLYGGRQLLYALPVMSVASVLVCYALRVAPGGPVDAVLNPLALEEARAQVRGHLGLDQPEERGEQGRDPEGVGGQHHVLARRVQARAPPTHDVTQRAQGAVGVLLVLPLDAHAPVGVPEDQDEGAGHVHVVDR